MRFQGNSPKAVMVPEVILDFVKLEEEKPQGGLERSFSVSSASGFWRSLQQISFGFGHALAFL